MSKTFIALLTMILGLGLLVACGPIENGTEKDPDIEAMIEQGKELLAAGDSQNAGEIFRDVLMFEADNGQAHYGIALADLLDLVHLADDFVVFLTDQFAGGGQEKSGLSPAGIGDTLDKYIGDIFEPVFLDFQYHTHLAYADKDLVFELEALPLTFGGELIVDLGGQWDHADAALLISIADFMAGFSDLLLALDLNFNLGYVFDLPLNFSDLSGIDLGAIWRDLVHLVVLLLSDPQYPNFLGPNSSAEARLPRSAVALGLGCGAFIETGSLARSENDDQLDDIIAYADLDDSGGWDEGEPFALPKIGALDDRQSRLITAIALLLADLRGSLLDGSELDADPNLTDPFDLASANPLVMALADWEFGPLPHYEIDLGYLFLHPQENADNLKSSVLNVLLCVDQNQDPLKMIRCLISVFQADGVGD